MKNLHTIRKIFILFFSALEKAYVIYPSCTSAYQVRIMCALILSGDINSGRRYLFWQEICILAGRHCESCWEENK